MRKRHLFFKPILCFAWIQENDLRADVNLTQSGIQGEVRKLPLPLKGGSWSSGQRVGLAIRRSRVRVPLWSPFLESPDN